MEKKMRKNILMYMFGMLAVLMGCFFNTPEEVKAAQVPEAGVSVQMQEPTLVQAAAYNSDIPAEVTNPIDKGKKLVAYVVVAAGWVCFIIGLLFVGIAFFGHQSDMRIQGIIAVGVGALLGVAPTIATWIMS